MVVKRTYYLLVPVVIPIIVMFIITLWGIFTGGLRFETRVTPEFVSKIIILDCISDPNSFAFSRQSFGRFYNIRVYYGVIDLRKVYYQAKAKANVSISLDYSKAHTFKPLDGPLLIVTSDGREFFVPTGKNISLRVDENTTYYIYTPVFVEIDGNRYFFSTPEKLYYKSIVGDVSIYRAVNFPNISYEIFIYNLEDIVDKYKGGMVDVDVPLGIVEWRLCNETSKVLEEGIPVTLTDGKNYYVGGLVVRVWECGEQSH